MFSRLHTLIAPACALAALLLATPARCEQATPPVQKAGKYTVELRLPTEGVFADEETDVEFHVTDTSQDDPVQGAPPVVKAKVGARITMPAMPSMPQQTPATHSEGVPGDYGVVCFFPHGGDYRLTLNITPPDGPAFTVDFPVAVKDAEAGKNRKPKPKPYTLEVKTTPATPHVGEPVEISLLIRSRDTKQPVTEFDLTHEKQMHLVIVSKDLSRFAHEHPYLDAGGKFTLKYAFPTGGEYHLFADVAPHGAGGLVLMQSITVSGPPPSGSVTTAARNGIAVTLKTDVAKLASGRMLPITFALKDPATGTPITDLEPYLGAMGHLILIHEDGTTFVHCHPDESDATNGRQGTITFLARLPKLGVYHGWMQFQRGGEVRTYPFTATAKESQG